MSIYEIPLAVRYIDVSEGSVYQTTKSVVLNGKGVAISFNAKKPVDLKELKNIEPSIRKTFVLIPANGYADAIVKLFINCKSMVVGGSSVFSKAMWVDTKKAIIEFPSCFMMHMNEDGVPVCGKLGHCGGGEFGPCYVDDYIPQDFCPFVLSRCNVISNYKKYLDSASTVTYKNIKYKLIKVKQDIESPKVDFKYMEIGI